MLSAEQCPYTGKKGSDATKHDHEAPTIEALKRAMVRLGFLDKKLSELDEYWAKGSMFDAAWGEWSIKKGFQDDSVYGEGKWEEIRKVTIPAGSPRGRVRARLLRAGADPRRAQGDGRQWRRADRAGPQEGRCLLRAGAEEARASGTTRRTARST